MDQFVTVYRKDYVRKPIKKANLYTAKQEFRNPISRGFKKYLYLKSDNLSTPYEEANDYLEKFKTKYPDVSKTYFSNALNRNVLERSFTFDGKTSYQADYCDLVNSLDYKENVQKNLTECALADDWEIPLTTQRKSYRDPFALNIEPVTPIRPIINLEPDENMRTIMKVKTGLSEYQTCISALGDIIIEDAIHGKIIHIPCKNEHKR